MLYDIIEDIKMILKIAFTVIVIIATIFVGVYFSYNHGIKDPVNCTAEIQKADKCLYFKVAFIVEYTYSADGVVYAGKGTVYKAVDVGSIININYSKSDPYKSEVIE